MKQEIFSIEDGCIRHKEITQLYSIYVQLFAKEATAIIFNNSEEKNAFIRFLSGDVSLYSGRLHIEDQLIYKLDAPHKIKETIFVVGKITCLNKRLSIVENLYFDSFKKLCIQKNLYVKKTAELFLEFGLDINLNIPISKLSPFQCTIVEILKGYVTNHKVIVLANVTGALDTSQTRIITNLTKQLKSLGLSFLIIGAFEEILFEQTHTVCVVQGGRTIGVFQSNAFNDATLHKLLYKYSLPIDDKQISTTRSNVFSMHHVDGTILKDINISLRQGEILKIIYSDDKSASELISIMKGNRDGISGNIYLNHKLYQTNNIQEALKAGVGFVEENPIETMLFKNLTIIDNICYPLSNKINGFWLRHKFQRSVQNTLSPFIDSKYFRKSISEVPAKTLYQICYCKWLLFMPKVLVCIDPFSVADYQINEIIRQMIEYLSARGICVIIISSYWPSLCTIKGKLKYLENGYLKEQEMS